jgi:hypothetical protein
MQTICADALLKYRSTPHVRDLEHPLSVISRRFAASAVPDVPGSGKVEERPLDNERVFRSLWPRSDLLKKQQLQNRRASYHSRNSPAYVGREKEPELCGAPSGATTRILPCSSLIGQSG